MVAIATPDLAPVPARARAGLRRPGRAAVLAVAAVYFLGPLAAAFWFSVHDQRGTSFAVYGRMWSAPGFGHAALLSVELAVVTVLLALGLMVPTLLLVHLRHPRMRSLVEVLSLLPLVIPPIVLVVGVSRVIGWGNGAPVGSPRAQVFNQLLNSNPPLILPLEYVVLVLPFVFRALDAGLRASGLTTLVEAARNLGAGLATTVRRVVLPTLRTSLLNAAFLAFALVLGEFTMASLLQYQPFAVWLLQFDNSDGQLSVALSLLSLALTWALLMVMTAAAGRTPGKVRR